MGSSERSWAVYSRLIPLMLYPLTVFRLTSLRLSSLLAANLFVRKQGLSR